MKNKLIVVGLQALAEQRLTIRALECLQKAKVVLYDAPISDNMMRILPVDTLKIFVGNCPGQISQPQEKLNQLVVSYALIYGTVVRLLQDDSFLLESCIHEIFHAKQHNIEIELIPYSNIAPWNNLNAQAWRQFGIAKGFRVLNAVERPNRFTRELEQAALSYSSVVIFADSEKVKLIAQTFLASDRKHTGVLIIRNDSSAYEKMTVTTIESLVYTACEDCLEGTVLFVIGEAIPLKFSGVKSGHHFEERLKALN